jgi:hypothetical protein
MAARRLITLTDAAGWWVLGVVIGGLSGDAVGAFAGMLPLLLVAGLGGALAALVAAATLCRWQTGVDSTIVRAQEAWLMEMENEVSELGAEVRSRRYQKKGSTPTPKRGMERLN